MLHHRVRKLLKRKGAAPLLRTSSAVLLCALFSAAASAAPAHGTSGEHALAQVVRAGGGRRYALSADGAVLFSADRGRSWEERIGELPEKKVWPWDGSERRACTALAVDPGNWRRVAVTTKKHLYLSESAGRRWRRVPLRAPVNGSNFLTALCISPEDGQTMYLGTSFNGLFVTRDGGESWEKVSSALEALYRGAGFYEEITALAMPPGEGTLYLASRFERSLYRYKPGRETLQQLPFPEELRGFYALSALGRGERKAVELHGAHSRFLYRMSSGSWEERPALLLREERGRAVGRRDELRFADRKGIYLNSWNASGQSLEEHLDFMERHGFDTLVVDVKDDWGKLTYRSRLTAPRRYGGVRGNMDLDLLLEKAHERGFYVVGRQVVFKDRVLYRARGSELAVWDAEKDEPWGHEVEVRDGETGEKRREQREFWVDPFSEEVWDYNIAIARELQRRGIDEIQFDYIRFPSDGDLGSVRYRHRREGMLKTEAIESFMRKADRSLDIPISVDLYGFNSWYRMGNWIGQDITMLSRYAEVICPMYYPSHFPSSFLAEQEYLQRAYTIYRTGTERARRLVDGRSVIRPYVQAFRVGRELRMEERTYNRYLSLQLQGVIDAGGSGYTLWNNANRYYMVSGSTSALNGESRDGTVQRRMAGP